MITQAESGLSAGDYNDLVSGTYPYTYKVLARKWGIGALSRVTHNSITSITNGNTSNFDICYGASNFCSIISGSATATDVFHVKSSIKPTIAWDSSTSKFRAVYVHHDNGTLNILHSTGTTIGITPDTPLSMPGGLTNQQTLYSETESYSEIGTATASTPAISGGWALTDLFNPANPNPTSFYRGSAFDPATALVRVTYTTAVNNCYKIKITSRDWTGLSGTKYASRMPRNFTLETTTDGVNWVLAATLRKQTNWGPKESRYYDIPLGNYRGIRLKTTATNGSTAIEIGKIQFVVRVSNTVNSVVGITNTSWDYLFYVYRDYTKNVWNIRYAKRTGAEGVTFTHYDTGIYLQRPIKSIDGCYNSTDNEHVLAINMIESGPVVYKAEGAKAVPYSTSKSSTYVIKLTPQSSGNPLSASWLIPVDFVSPASAYKNRQNVGINYVNGMYMLTLRSNDANDYAIQSSDVSADGGEATAYYASYSSYRLYTSVDGLKWSQGYKIPGSESYVRGAGTPILVGNTIYMFTSGYYVGAKGWSACVGFSFDSGVQTGTMLSPTDLTDKILEYSIDKGEFFSANMSLDNSTGEFDNHAIINKDSVAYLEHYHGIQRGPGDSVYLLIGKTLTETMQFDQSIDSKTVIVGSRDLLSLATDHVVSEDAVYLNSQRVFFDNYVDTTDSGYGGLAHTAKHKGAVVSENGYLQTTDENQAITFSTFASDFRDFMIENWVYSHTGDKYGLIFKAIDPRNYFFFEIEDNATANQVLCKLYYKRKNEYTLLNSWTVSLLDTQFRRYYTCFGARFLFMDSTEYIVPGMDLTDYSDIKINALNFYPDNGFVGFEITNINASEDTYTDENGVPATLPPGQVL